MDRKGVAAPGGSVNENHFDGRKRAGPIPADALSRSSRNRGSLLNFLWRTRGAIKLAEGPSRGDRLMQLAHAIEGQGKRVSERGGDFFKFEGSFIDGLRRPQWRALALYNQGRIWIETRPQGDLLRYDLSSLTIMTCCLALAAAIGGGRYPNHGPAAAAVTALAVFAALYGLNILIGYVRAWMFFRRAV